MDFLPLETMDINAKICLPKTIVIICNYRGGAIKTYVFSPRRMSICATITNVDGTVETGDFFMYHLLAMNGVFMVIIPPLRINLELKCSQFSHK